MDPIGFSIGVAPLAAQVYACIAAFDHLYSMGQISDQDSELLFAKLDIEKDRFLQWVFHVGLFSPQLNNADIQLFVPHNSRLSLKILSVVYHLLADIEGPTTKCGLQRVRLDDKATQLDIVSSSRRRYLQQTIPDPPGPGQQSQRTTLKQKWLTRDKIPFVMDNESTEPKNGPSKTFVWSIDSPSKFTKWLNELSFFVTKLNDMISMAERRRMIREDLLASEANLHTLRLIETATQGVYDEWSTCARLLADKAEADSSQGETQANIGVRILTRFPQDGSSAESQHDSSSGSTTDSVSFNARVGYLDPTTKKQSDIVLMKRDVLSVREERSTQLAFKSDWLPPT